MASTWAKSKSKIKLAGKLSASKNKVIKRKAKKKKNTRKWKTAKAKISITNAITKTDAYLQEKFEQLALSEQEQNIAKHYEKCKETLAKFNKTNSSFVRSGVKLKKLCNMLAKEMATMRKEIIEANLIIDEENQKQLEYYRGISSYYLGLINNMEEFYKDAANFFEQAVNNFYNALDTNFESKAIREYLSSVQKSLINLHSDRRLEKLKRISQILTRAINITWRHIDKAVLDHNKKIVEKVILNMSLCIVIDYKETNKINATFVLYQCQPRDKNANKMELARAAVIIEASDDVTVLLAAQPYHGDVGNIASDKIHRPAIAFETYVKPFPRVEGRIETSEGDQVEFCKKSIQLVDFHAKANRFQNAVTRRLELGQGSLHDGAWRDVPEDMKGETSFYWPDSGEKQNTSILPHEDARLGAKRLSAGHTANQRLNMRPDEFVKFAISVEQCDAMKAYLIQKRLELASTKSILDTEKKIEKLRESENNTLFEDIRSLKSFSELMKYHLAYLKRYGNDGGEDDEYNNDDDDDIVNIEIGESAFAGFESPVKMPQLGNPLGLCAGGRVDVEEEAEEETKMNNIKAGNDEKKKSDKEGCCIS